MLKIRALNRESSSDEEVPVIRREAQEEIALELYNKALRLQGKGENSEAESILLKLIEENIPLLENNGGLPKSMSTLKYSCYVNLGNIYLNENKINKALESYLTASDLDATDVTLWFKIGKLSLKEDKFRQSSYAFSKGLECSESHWPCLDNLITVLFAIKDTVGCLVYIGKALMLDADYLKGLVLRRQIYRDNPATKEYYRLYNPDYIWEPPLDVHIDEEDEKEILEEIQVFCNHVNEVEKSYAPKPLQTIALPKPLEDYTWMSLAKTITHLHRYITDNGMSHFTFIDLSKCMSQTSEPLLKSPVADFDNQINEQNTEKIFDEVVNVNNTEIVAEVEEKMDIEAMPERRFSQNSETNNDGQENTPIQTDNDEELNMEQDNEEPDDNSEIKTDRGRPRGVKRKRDVLSDLQIWGWHSKRKQSKKVKDRDFTVEDALNRIIPKSLLNSKIEAEKFIAMEDSMNTMDIYNLYMEDNNVNYLSPIHSPKSVNYEAYFGTDRERDDVIELWLKKREYCDAIVLIKDLVFTLSKLWHYKWPKELVPLYIDAYNMFREHCDQPQVWCGDFTFKEIRNDALATLLFGELLTFSSDSKETIHPTALGYLQIVSVWQEQWQEEFSSVFNRTSWLRCHLFRKENSIDLAIRCLQLIQEVIEEEETSSKEKYLLSLPNCFRYGLITNQITEKMLKHLDVINSLGTIESLYNNEKYVEVAEILKQTFNTGNHPQVGRMGRPAQLGFLLHSLWFTDLTECFIWAEECLYESLDHYLKPRKDSDKWEKVLEKCLGICHEIIKKETVCIVDFLTEQKRARFVESLGKIISKQLNSENTVKMSLGCVTPWILLHYLLLREEHRQYANKRNSQGKRDRSEIVNNQDVSENELPPSIAILFSAHDFLGPKSWCLTGQGELLHFILDTVLDRLDTPVFEHLRDKMDIHIEQALFCLYQHPSKKNKISRHLADHNVDPLPLTWERAFQLFEFYGPDCLPEFNSYKNVSISADLEQLLKRIIALVPPECAPQNHLPKIMDFIHTNTDKCPEPIDFPNKVRSIYYLIGDFYFKMREFARCIKYFQMDVCINPLRLDSWACLGLSYAAQLDTKLNHCLKFKSESEFLDKAKYASVCFKKALTISPDHLVLWIEYGTFQYTVHSYCSRILKYESENLSMEKFEFLENQKNTYLDSSGNSFEKAIALYEMEDTSEPDERWLQYYILGKIAEKKQKEPAEYLQYYMTASTLLDENHATYPEKIFYNNPQHLAVEALELHYRMHASILKYLELHEGKDIPSSLGAFFKKCLNSSKFLNKPAPKVIPEPAIVPETPVKVSESSGLSFQDQFLHSLSTLTEDEPNRSTEDVQEANMLPAVEDVSESPSKANSTVLQQKDVEKAKECEQPMSIVKDDDVIMISDSEDEKCEDESKKEDDKTVEDERKTIKDVQQMLDEMMVKTMKEVEEQPIEEDSGLSGTEKFEEVVCKESKDTTEVKQVSDIQEIDKPTEKPAVKPSDSETDTDNIRTSVDDDSSSSSSSSSTSSSSSDSDSDDDDDSSSTSSSSSSGVNSENMSNSEILQIVDRCIAGLEICIIRLTQNYKALYRLAHLFFYYKAKKDLNKCKQLLLGEYKCKDGTIVAGLFNDRKINNFFNGIWRIPSNEIDRPGSLSAHMSRCISLLLQVLRNTNDNKILIDLYMQLRRSPDPDKVYIKDSERLAFSEQALTMCTQTLRSQIKNMPNMTNPQIVKLLQEIFRVHQRIQKNLSSQDNVFSNMLVEVYKKFIKEKIPDNVNVLELAVKFCQQNKSVEKNKLQVQNQVPPMPRGPGIASPPVLPPPVKVAPSAPILLKRPGVGRPRGRPPLPKIPGQVRQPRGKSPGASGLSKSYAWQKSLFDQSYAYEYLKQYQDELIKQYSQNLSLNQLTQLSQVLAQGQINNPLTASVITNQFLTQTGLLAPSNLMKQMGAPTTSSSAQPSAASMVADSLNHLNSSVKKKMDVEQALSSLSSEQLKYLGSMLPPTSKIPHVPKNTFSQTAGLSSGVTSNKPKVLPTSSKSVAPSISKHIPSELSRNKAETVVTKPPTSSQIFKEPTITKPSTSEDKAAKVLMKDRPNISITPVAGALPVPLSTTGFSRSVVTTTVSTSFTRPTLTTSPSGGKTLQEKLAEKKKEQFNKQQQQQHQQHQQKSFESDVYSSDAILKSLNLPSIPSSLTVSKASLPMPPGFPGISLSKTSPNVSNSKPATSVAKSIPSSPKLASNLSSVIPNSLSAFPVDLGVPTVPKSTFTSQSKYGVEPSLPSSLTVSKSTIPLQTPKFPLESGISITQVPISLSKTTNKNFPPTKKSSPTANVLKHHKTIADQTQKSKEKIVNTIKQDKTSVIKSFPSSVSVDISPVKNKSEKHLKKSHKGLVNRSALAKSLDESSKQVIEFGQKPVRTSKTVDQYSISSILDKNIAASFIKNYKNIGSTSGPEASQKTSIPFSKTSGKTKDVRHSHILPFKKDKSILKMSSSSQSSSKKEPDDDVICID